MLLYPIYVGNGLSHGTVILPQQLESVLRGRPPHSHRPPVLPPRLTSESVSDLNLDDPHHGISISMHICMVRRDEKLEKLRARPALENALYLDSLLLVLHAKGLILCIIEYTNLKS